MANLLDTLRARRANLSKVDTRAVWDRTSSLVGTLWRPTRGDGSLPQWLHLLVGVSDDGLRIPGTKVRVGLDAVLGALLPGAGDALGGVTAAMLMFVAWRRGAPGNLLLKMLGNASVDIGVGAIPLVGDIFNLGFHANRRNLSLLEEHVAQRSKAERASRAIFLLLLAILLSLMLVALAATIGLAVVLWRKWQVT